MEYQLTPGPSRTFSREGSILAKNILKVDEQILIGNLFYKGDNYYDAS